MSKIVKPAFYIAKILLQRDKYFKNLTEWERSTCEGYIEDYTGRAKSLQRDGITPYPIKDLADNVFECLVDSSERPFGNKPKGGS